MTTSSLTRFCLIRHGETDWNLARRLQGHIDIPLNDTGERQADLAAAGLRDKRFTALYASDLVRAKETAAPLARLFGLQVETTPALRERHYGVFQGLTYEEIEQRYPAEYARYRARDPELLPEGGESLLGAAARVRSLLSSLVERHRGESVLLVTHGGVLDLAYRIATGKPLQEPRDFAIPNAAHNWLRHDGQGWSIEHWADQRHLDMSLDEL